MAKKKTTRKTAPKAKPKASKAASKTASRTASKSSAKGRPAPKPSRHGAHTRGTPASRHTPKKVARKPGSKTPELFAQALDMAQSGFLFDAIFAFKALASDRKSDMADDAQCNIGLCYLRMHLYADALIAFNHVLTDFPGACIAQVAGASHEFGQTTAKARLGRVHAFLGAGDTASARAECDAMSPDRDSHVVSADGTKKSFFDLADAAVRAAGA